jgi:tetratricopeptide (TPR) repeat protein
VYDHSHRGQPAIDYNEQALAIAQELQDHEFQAICLANRVAIRTAGWGQIVETTTDAEEAVRLSKEIKNQPLLAKSLGFVGAALQWRGEFDRSLQYLHEAAELAHKVHAGFVYGLSVFQIGHANLSKGNYEEALRWYKQLGEYASAAGDKYWIARAPNLIGAVHLEVYDLDAAAERNLEADEIARSVWPWPEPRGHSLLKVGLAHFEKDEHAKATHYLQCAWDLLEQDTWSRWRWHIPLLRARGALALSEGRFDEAWKYANESLEMATRTDSRKHVVRAQQLRGEVLAARGKLDEAAGVLDSSVALALRLKAAPDVWQTCLALGKVLHNLGRENEAEARLTKAAGTVEAIAQNLRTLSLRRSFISARPMLDLYNLLHRSPPQF